MALTQTGIKPLTGAGIPGGQYDPNYDSSAQNFLPPASQTGQTGQQNYATPETAMGSIDYWNQIPEAGYWQYLNQRGLLGQSNPSKYAQGRQGYYYNRYLADAAQDPNMGFFDYLQRNQFDPQADYFAQSPTQRGDFSSRFLTPRGRWVNVG